MLRPHRPHVLVLALTVTVLATGCTRQVTTSDADANAPVRVKTVAVMQTEVARTTTQPATIYPYFEAEVRPRVAGYVKAIHADIGDVVAAGDSLATIDVPEMVKQREVRVAQLERLRAEEARAVAGIELAAANVAASQAMVTESKSQLAGADALVAASSAELDRVDDLVTRRSLAGRMLDEARKKNESDEANRDAAESAISSAQSHVNVARAKLVAAEADFKAAQAESKIGQAQIEELDVMMAYAKVEAPFAGIVTARSIDPGDLVQSGDTQSPAAPMFVVSQLDKVRVHVQVPEVEAVHVDVGDGLTLTFPSFGGEKLSAMVTRLSQSLDDDTRTMLVEAEVDNADGKLLPGMFGEASIGLESRVAANMLPARAVRFGEDGKPFVYVVGADDKVSVVEIKTGVDDGRRIEVVSGLKANQEVIDAHLKRFTDGQTVARITN